MEAEAPQTIQIPENFRGAAADGYGRPRYANDAGERDKIRAVSERVRWLPKKTRMWSSLISSCEGSLVDESCEI